VPLVLSVSMDRQADQVDLVIQVLAEDLELIAHLDHPGHRVRSNLSFVSLVLYFSNNSSLLYTA